MQRTSVVLALAALLNLMACVSIVGGPGGISPEQFQFEPRVPLRAPGPGGWKSARAIIQLAHVTERGVRRNVLCPIEVQVPEVNYARTVDDEFAQLEAAKAADIAAAWVLEQQNLFSAEMCDRFQKKMREEMSENIPGVRVIKAL
jgi:hypothetical protein